MLLQSILSQYVTDDVPEGPWIRFGLRGQKTYLYDKNNLAKTYETMKRSDFEDPFNGQKGYYHFSSSHQELRRIFRTAEDFAIGVNTLALLLPYSNVKILAYCLMDNHIHILLEGTLRDCLAFYDRIVHRLAQILGKRYGISGVLRSHDLDIVAVTSEDQMKKEICYIHRNPYKARIASPDGYRWSSADVYFKTHQPNGMHVNSLCLEERRRIFRTKFAIPDSYEYRDGVILNTCFVSSAIVSGLFNGSVEYFDFLRKYSLEAEVEEKHGVHLQLKFSDAEIQERINDICINEFHARSVRHLDRKCLLRVARIAAARFGAGRAQLSRLLGIDKDILDRIL